MKTLEEINVFKCLDYIRDNAKKYAQAKGRRVQIEEFRKVLKAKLMATQLGEPVNAREIYAYSHPDYEELLLGLQAAIEEEENLRWKIEAARLKVNVWQSLGANQRAENKML